MAFLTDIGYLQGIEKPGGEGMNEMGFTVGPRGENAIYISIGNIYKFLMLQGMREDKMVGWLTPWTPWMVGPLTPWI